MLILPLHRTHFLLRHPAVIFDVVYGLDALGRPTISQEADRTVLAGVQPAGNDVVALLPEGAQSDGVLVVHSTTRMTLATNVNGATHGRQTFLRRPDGNLWKCWREQDWRPHAVIGKWFFTRYVNTDGTIT